MLEKNVYSVVECEWYTLPNFMFLSCTYTSQDFSAMVPLPWEGKEPLGNGSSLAAFLSLHLAYRKLVHSCHTHTVVVEHVPRLWFLFSQLSLAALQAFLSETSLGKKQVPVSRGYTSSSKNLVITFHSGCSTRMGFWFSTTQWAYSWWDASLPF